MTHDELQNELRNFRISFENNGVESDIIDQLVLERELDLRFGLKEAFTKIQNALNFIEADSRFDEYSPEFSALGLMDTYL